MPQQSFSLGEITRATSIDRRSLTNLIEEYHSLELEHSGLIFTFNTDQLIVSTKSFFTISGLSRLLFRQTLLFKLFISIFNQKFTTLTDFTNDSYISPSSMYRRLERARLVLSDYHLELSFTNNKFILGPEKQIRHFFFDLYSYAYELSTDEDTTLFSSSPLAKEALVKHFSHLPIPFYKKTRLATYIFFTRFKQGYDLAESELVFESYDIHFSHRQLSSFMCELVECFDPNSPSALAEANFFSFYLQTSDLIALDEFNLFNFSPVNFDNPYIILANEWISELIAFFNISLTPSEQFFLLINLYHHFTRDAYFQQASRYNHTSLLSDASNNDNPYIFNKVINFLANIENPRIPQGQALTYLYYLLIKDVLLNRDITINACVFSSLFHSQKVNIEKKIARLSAVEVHFHERLSVDIDLVVADFNWRSDLLDQYPIQWITTNTFPSNEEYEAILTQILKVYDTKISDSDASGRLSKPLSYN